MYFVFFTFQRQYESSWSFQVDFCQEHRWCFAKGTFFFFLTLLFSTKYELDRSQCLYLEVSYCWIRFYLLVISLGNLIASPSVSFGTFRILNVDFPCGSIRREAVSSWIYRILMRWIGFARRKACQVGWRPYLSAKIVMVLALFAPIGVLVPISSVV